MEALVAGWLEERWRVDVGHLVKMVEVYRSVGTSRLIVDSQKS